MEKKLRSRPEHKLERFRGLFLQLGLTIALGAVWMAFEWSQPMPEGMEIEDPVVLEWEDPVIPLTMPKELKPKVVKAVEPQVEPDVWVLNKSDISYIPDIGNQDDYNDSVQVIDRVFELDPVEFHQVEMMPRFEACEGVSLDLKSQQTCFEAELQKALVQNFKYPKRSILVQEQGVVWLAFVVNQKGEFVNIEVERGVGPDLDAEAVRALSKVQRVQPATIGGRKVSVKYVIPLKAILK